MTNKKHHNYKESRAINEKIEGDSSLNLKNRSMMHFDCTLDQLNQIQEFLQNGKEMNGGGVMRERETLIRGCIGIINEIYRAKSRLDRVSESDIPDSLRNFRLYIQKIWEHIELMGFEVKDYLNEPYNDGLPLEVLEFSPVNSIPLPLVSEIVRPSIKMKSQDDPLRSVLVQKGAVFVSIPPSE